MPATDPTDTDPTEPESRTWFERNGLLAALVLFGLPLLLGLGLRELGVSDTAAELTQIVVGVTALIAVAVYIVRVRRG